MDHEQKRQAVLAGFAQQVEWCEQLGSSFTARVLTILAEDIAAGGIVAELVGAWPGEPVAEALALRLAGALHALVLTETAPALAAVYPPRAATAAGELRMVLLSAVADHRVYVEDFLVSPPQTNEVGRSGVLLGGFLEIARQTGLPLRLLEIGASAGLNTVWDRFHYRLCDAEWGDRHSEVHIAPGWQGPLPPLGTPIRVADRRACDIAPIDLEDAAQRLRLRAYIWPDQRERLSRLDGAIATTRAHGKKVDRADAAHWVRARLREPADTSVTVLYHSIMWQYMPAKTQADIRESLEQAGSRAPLAWLRFEPHPPEFRQELRLTLWPDGQETCLATAHPHGSTVVWSGL